jgi:hypothetical protein
VPARKIRENQENSVTPWGKMCKPAVLLSRRLGSGAILRNREGCIERLKNALCRVDVDAGFLKTVQERPSGGGERGVELVARIVSRDLEDDGCSLCCLLVKLPGRQAGRNGSRQRRRPPMLGVVMHHVVPPV